MNELSEEETKAIKNIKSFAKGNDLSCVSAREMQILLNLYNTQNKVIDKMAAKLEEKSRWMTKEKWKNYFFNEVKINE